jgi:hypothetical protein
METETILELGPEIVEFRNFYPSGQSIRILYFVQVIKKLQNSRKQSFFFSYFCCLFMEGSGSTLITPDPGPGGPKAIGSGSGTLLQGLF